MSPKEIIFEKEKISTYKKISEEVLSELRISKGYDLDDFLTETLTVKLTGYIYSNLAEERDLIYYCDKPSFLDWILRRRKKVVFNLKVKDLILNPPKLENTARIYITENIMEQ